MLPLRANKKPQLLPIKQLLMKQKDEHARAEEHLNTDDYLLWKSVNEPNEKKSVSFSLRNNEIGSKYQDGGVSEGKRPQRLKHEIFFEDSATLWDSDEVDDSLQNQINSLNQLKTYEYENNDVHSNESCNTNRSFKNTKKQRKSSSSANQSRKDETLMKKLIEVLHLTIKESIDDIQRNLSEILESKITQEISEFRNSLSLDSLNNLKSGIESISKNLQLLQTNQRQELMKFEQNLLDHVSSMSVGANQSSKSDDLKDVEERICTQITENLNTSVQNLEKQFKSSNLKQEAQEDKYEKFFHQNTAKLLQELDARIESLTKEMKKIVQLSQRNSHSFGNVAPRPTIHKGVLSKLNVSNCDDFYRSIDDELDQYRSIYIDNNNVPINYHHQFKPTMCTSSDNQWKPW